MPEETTVTPTAPAVEGVSSTPPAAAQAASSETSQVSPAPKTLGDLAKDIAKKAGVEIAESQTATDTDAEASEGTTDKEEPSVVEETTEEKVVEVTKDEDLPFHKHPRWQEVIRERNNAVGELEKVKPLAERAQQINDYCQRYGVSEQQVNEAIEIAALLVNDPITARARLQPIMNVLDGYSGDSLPEDLAQEVADGTLTQKRAKELAQARTALAMQQRRGQMTERQGSQVQQSALQTALQVWDMSHRKTDPDFAPKTDAKAPDGKYELFRDKMTALIAVRQIRTPEEAIGLAEEALDAVEKVIARYRTPKKPTSKSLPVNGSSTTTAAPKPKSLLDVARLVAAKHRA